MPPGSAWYCTVTCGLVSAGEGCHQQPPRGGCSSLCPSPVPTLGTHQGNPEQGACLQLRIPRMALREQPATPVLALLANGRKNVPSRGNTRNKCTKARTFQWGVHPKELKTGAQTNIWTPRFTAVMFTAAKKRRSPTCPGRNDWPNTGGLYTRRKSTHS